MKNIIKLALVLCCMLLLWAQPVFAENNPVKISNLDTSIMPEYDTGDVLVINTVSFTNNSSLPYKGELRFPVPNKTTNNVVIETNDSKEKNLALKVEAKGSFAEFVWKPSQPIQPNSSYFIHLEYYYNPLPGTGAKAFIFQYNATLPVDQAQIQVYKPLKASNFKMDPIGHMVGKADQGFEVYGLYPYKMNVGDKVDIKVSYTKDDPAPSVQQAQTEVLPEQPEQAPSDQPGQSVSGPLAGAAMVAPIMAVILGLGFVAIKLTHRAGENKEERDVP